MSKKEESKNLTSADLEESARQLQEVAKREREAARLEREAAQKEKEAAKLLRQAAKQAAKEQKEAKRLAKLEGEKEKVGETIQETDVTKKKQKDTSTSDSKSHSSGSKALDESQTEKETTPSNKSKKSKNKKKSKQEKTQTEKQEKTTSSTVENQPKKEKSGGNFFKYLNYLLIILIVLTLLLAGLVLYGQTSSGKALWNNIQKSGLGAITNSNNNQTEEEEETVDPSALKEGSNHINSADEYAYSTEKIREYITGQEETDEKIVFLTFDDGVAPGYSDKVLDILQEYGVHGTFFLIGNYLQNIEDDVETVHDIMKRQINEGHAIASHSMSHNMDLLYPGKVPNLKQIVAEAQEEQELFKSILGSDFETHVFRYPGGHMSWAGLEETDSALEEVGFQWIDWNKSVGDAEPESRRPTDLESMIEFHTKSSEDFPEASVKVVLMHDTFGKSLTIKALPEIIEYYQNEGYKFGILE